TSSRLRWVSAPLYFRRCFTDIPDSQCLKNFATASFTCMKRLFASSQTKYKFWPFTITLWLIKELEKCNRTFGTEPDCNHCNRAGPSVTDRRRARASSSRDLRKL